MPRIARVAALLSLVVALSACDMTIRMTTKVESDGSGVFGIAFVLDEELVNQLRSADAGGGDAGRALEDLRDLGSELERRGWDVRTQGFEGDAERPEKGGVLLEGSRGFPDARGFDAALDELREVMASVNREGVAGEREGFTLTLDHSTEDSFFRRGATFGGTFRFDTGVPAFNEAFAEFVHFEIAAELPGDVVVTEGDGTVREGVVTWRPPIGERYDYAAESTSLKIGSILLVVVPALLLVGLIAGLILGRAKPEDDAQEEERLLVLDEEVPDVQERRAAIVEERRSEAASREPATAPIATAEEPAAEEPAAEQPAAEQPVVDRPATLEVTAGEEIIKVEILEVRAVEEGDLDEDVIQVRDMPAEPEHASTNGHGPVQALLGEDDVRPGGNPEQS